MLAELFSATLTIFGLGGELAATVIYVIALAIGLNAVVSWFSKKTKKN